MLLCRVVAGAWDGFIRSPLVAPRTLFVPSAGWVLWLQTDRRLKTNHHCFDALNTPADHPARDTQDTFFYVDAPGRPLSDAHLVGSNSGPEANAAPIRIIVPGRVYRRIMPMRPTIPPFIRLKACTLIAE